MWAAIISGIVQLGSQFMASGGMDDPRAAGGEFRDLVAMDIRYKQRAAALPFDLERQQASGNNVPLLVFAAVALVAVVVMVK